MDCNPIRSDYGSSESETTCADLHADVLDLILTKLVLIPDYIRFGAVCRQWHSIFLGQKQKRMESCRQQPPMLMIPADDGSQQHRNLCSVFEDNKVYHCSFPIPFSKKCYGCSYGWWAFAERDFAITLINPFSRKTIHLPPVMRMPHYDPPYGEESEESSVDGEIPDFDSYDNDQDEDNPVEDSVYIEHLIHKVVLSCDPCLHPEDYVVAAIHGIAPRVGFIRSGQQSWNYPYERFVPVTDVQFYKGRLYAVNGHNKLVAVDYFSADDSSGNGNCCGDSSDNRDDRDAATEDEDGSEDSYDGDGTFQGDAPMEHLIMQDPTHWSEYSTVSYLVESLEKDLLFVRRIYLFMEDSQNYDFQATVDFKIYKLTIDHEGPKWVEIQSLGNSALFLGANHSMCISVSSFPNCKPNSIYFTDDNMERNLDKPYEAIDMGVFDLENRQIEKHYDLPESLRKMPSAVWICPGLK